MDFIESFSGREYVFHSEHELYKAKKIFRSGTYSCLTQFEELLNQARIEFEYELPQFNKDEKM